MTLAGPTYRVKRNPNFDNLRRSLLRLGPPGPVPIFENGADPAMVLALTGETGRWRSWGLYGGMQTQGEFESGRHGRDVFNLTLRFCYENGYDYVWAWTGLVFPRANFHALQDTAPAENWEGGVRFWQDESSGPIQTWADFESYPWPKLEDISYGAVEYFNRFVPDGMKVGVNFFGILENTSWLMGLEPLCYALADDPSLPAAIFQRVGDLTLAAVDYAATVDNVGFVVLGDDMGWASSTLLSPAVLRKHVLPHHARIVNSVHAAGKPIVLHSCGNVLSLMDDFIEIGFDAKHAYEDKIMPVEDVYRRWGDRISIAGGIDMDILGRGTEEQVRHRVRQVLEVCAEKGTGYVLGSGNGLANFIPPQNYLAMAEEGRRWNRDHYGTP